LKSLKPETLSTLADVLEEVSFIMFLHCIASLFSIFINLAFPFTSDGCVHVFCVKVIGLLVVTVSCDVLLDTGSL